MTTELTPTPNLEMQPLTQALDILCPMHLHLDASGTILHAGPTLAKLLPATDQRLMFATVFEIERPPSVRTIDQMMQMAGKKLHLRLRANPQTRLKATLAPHPIGPGALMDISFGISFLEGVRDYKLTGVDFAPTDLTIEMLYLVEANSAAMEASRSLNAKLKDAMTRAEEQAYTDPLTGLKNRRAFDDLLTKIIEKRQDFSLMHVDLDFFKQVNDTLGHAAGDHVLQGVARIMGEETRRDDIVARVGGDEFILIFPNLVNRQRLDETATRLIARLSEPFYFQDKPAHISASAGVVRSVDYPVPSLDRLISDADAALYASKDRGRKCHTLHIDLPMSKAS